LAKGREDWSKVFDTESKTAAEDKRTFLKKAGREVKIEVHGKNMPWQHYEVMVKRSSFMRIGK